MSEDVLYGLSKIYAEAVVASSSWGRDVSVQIQVRTGNVLVGVFMVDGEVWGESEQHWVAS